MANFAEITHPVYDTQSSDWEKFRDTFKGGKEFVTKYLKKFSSREDDYEFSNRKDISHCPAHAKSAIIDIKNSIYQRMVDIVRTGGPLTYQIAIEGDDDGVDYNGNTMTSFIGRLILPELLSMAKVGVYIDKPDIEGVVLKSEMRKYRPYLYFYKTEDIRSWAFNSRNNLSALLLRDNDYKIDPDTGLVTDEAVTYRYLVLTEDGVKVSRYGEGGDLIDENVLALPEIPFVLFELTHSLLHDVADYQISLLNLASSDLSYALKANYPFYTEQYKPGADMPNIKSDLVGTENTVRTGTVQGRRYPIDTERPAFIHPSSEPLKASMEKQADLKKEIRELVNLSLSDVAAKSVSAESKKVDLKGLEAGLSYIGLELEYGERKIAHIWSLYEGHTGQVTIKYPDNYSLKSDDDRISEAHSYKELLPTIPSITYQREICKYMAKILIGSKISRNSMDLINSEIDSSPVVQIDPNIVRSDFEAGFVGAEFASTIRGYPDGEVEKAKVDHAERALRIAAAQSQASVANAAARGLDDLDSDISNKSAVEEKELAQDPAISETATKGVRGNE